MLTPKKHDMARIRILASDGQSVEFDATVTRNTVPQIAPSELPPSYVTVDGVPFGGDTIHVFITGTRESLEISTEGVDSGAPTITDVLSGSQFYIHISLGAFTFRSDDSAAHTAVRFGELVLELPFNPTDGRLGLGTDDFTSHYDGDLLVYPGGFIRLYPSYYFESERQMYVPTEAASSSNVLVRYKGKVFLVPGQLGESFGTRYANFEPVTSTDPGYSYLLNGVNYEGPVVRENQDPKGPPLDSDDPEPAFVPFGIIIMKNASHGYRQIADARDAELFDGQNQDGVPYIIHDGSRFLLRLNQVFSEAANLMVSENRPYRVTTNGDLSEAGTFILSPRPAVVKGPNDIDVLISDESATPLRYKRTNAGHYVQAIDGELLHPQDPQSHTYRLGLNAELTLGPGQAALSGQYRAAAPHRPIIDLRTGQSKLFYISEFAGMLVIADAKHTRLVASDFIDHHEMNGVYVGFEGTEELGPLQQRSVYTGQVLSSSYFGLKNDRDDEHSDRVGRYYYAVMSPDYLKVFASLALLYPGSKRELINIMAGLDVIKMEYPYALCYANTATGVRAVLTKFGAPQVDTLHPTIQNYPPGIVRAHLMSPEDSDWGTAVSALLSVQTDDEGRLPYIPVIGGVPLEAPLQPVEDAPTVRELTALRARVKELQLSLESSQSALEAALNTAQGSESTITELRQALATSTSTNTALQTELNTLRAQVVTGNADANETIRSLREQVDKLNREKAVRDGELAAASTSIDQLRLSKTALEAQELELTAQVEALRSRLQASEADLAASRQVNQQLQDRLAGCTAISGDGRPDGSRGSNVGIAAAGSAVGGLCLGLLLQRKRNR